MKKTYTLASLILSPLLMVGCSHSLKHGTIAMKTTDTVAHVSIHDVKPGDPIVLFHSVCSGSGGGKGEGGNRTCRREQVAKGEITQVLSEHYSEAQFPAGTKFAEGDFVETTK